MSEIWKAIDISPDYEVSNYGRFRSKDRKDIKRPYERWIKGKIMTPFISKGTGYLQVKINRKNYNLHRLVATAFCDGSAPSLVVNHKNGIRTDNRAENLEWVTHSENIRHAFRELGKRVMLPTY
ncbi:NUMOD4 motif-containing HNH endonuclease [Mixta sp. Marseille-Q2659]|uniref:NUMOD4 motif-containing HNH endonuclease n=1 Tax=Mixta sp. Marseille-Q2659 TaxID=2736607 RepID=UPI0023B9244E|nr:NUMOD4 motif-containing HNH endonuclease [Mixta sp. Marseille-Q2659]